MSEYDTKIFFLKCNNKTGDYMKFESSYQIYERLSKIDLDRIKKIICYNVRKYRLKMYDNYKKIYTGAVGIKNPYSPENVSSYLEMSLSNYKRIENPNDKMKYVSLKNLIKLSYLYDVRIDDFLKSDND